MLRRCTVRIPHPEVNNVLATLACFRLQLARDVEHIRRQSCEPSKFFHPCLPAPVCPVPSSCHHSTTFHGTRTEATNRNVFRLRLLRCEDHLHRQALRRITSRVIARLVAQR